jgi:small subunit ribosomal protein S17
MVTEGPEQVVATPGRASRTRRARRVGVVTSAARDKTVKVTVSFLVKHSKYPKLLQRRSVLHAHDEKNEAREGDLVEIAACRPISKTKHWRLVRVLDKAHVPASAGKA